MKYILNKALVAFSGVLFHISQFKNLKLSHLAAVEKATKLTLSFV